MDRLRARQAFDTYVAAYDPSNPRIALKVDHTLRVSLLCERIARSLLLPQHDVDLAWLVGLLHDIGRFEQVRRYDTFNDSISVSHAALGEKVLFDHDEGHDPLIRTFLPDSNDNQLIQVAVATHSAYRLSDDLDERTRKLCDILRDADKIDILAVNCMCPIQDIYGVTEQDMYESPSPPSAATSSTSIAAYRATSVNTQPTSWSATSALCGSSSIPRAYASCASRASCPRCSIEHGVCPPHKKHLTRWPPTYPTSGASKVHI